MPLTNGSQRPSPQPLGLQVVRLGPERLELVVIARAEGVTLQYSIEIAKVASMIGDDGLCLEDGLVPLEARAIGQRPQEPAEPLHGARLLEYLNRRDHRLQDDRRTGGHTVSPQNSSGRLSFKINIFFILIYLLVTLRLLDTRHAIKTEKWGSCRWPFDNILCPEIT